MKALLPGAQTEEKQGFLNVPENRGGLLRQ
jgi:hypothetical protein